MIPESRMLSFLLGSRDTPDRFKALLYRLQDCLGAVDVDYDIHKLINQICNLQLKLVSSKPKLIDRYMGSIMVAAYFIGNEKLFKHALSLVVNSFDETIFCKIGEHISLRMLTVWEQE